MAVLPKPFNAYEVEPSAPVSQLPVCPEGLPVVISASEFKAVKDKPNCYYIELALSVIDGSHKGSTGVYRLQLGNDNETTVRIANQQLSALCHVTGQMMISDTAQLHNIPFKVVTVAKSFKNDAGVEMQSSEVKSVLDINGNKPKAGAVVQAAQQAPAAPSFAAPAQPQQPAFAPPAPAFAPPAAAPAAGAPPWALKA